MTKSSEVFSFVTSFLILFLLTGVCGLDIPFERRAVRNGALITSPHSSTRYTFGSAASTETLDNKHDVRYAANITINGKEVPVAIDTGSTDLWVNPPGGIGDFNDTTIPLQLRYGDGTYGVSGTIGVSPFKIGSYDVPRQAFLYATTSTFGGLANYGLYGMLGLSFNLTTSSPIKREIQRRYGNDTTWGNSVLYNIFNEHPSQPDLIAMRLSRTDDLEDTKGGSFTIGEYDPDYASVTQSPKLAQYPEGGDRWTTLLEGIYVDGTAIPLTSRIKGVPAGHIQPMLDTGVPTAMFPAEIWDAIYGGIPGSAKYNQNLWLVPCNTTTLVEFSFAGVKYLMHPLDLTIISQPHTVNGRQVISCVSAINPLPSNWGGNGYEMLLGDSFLRNVYSVFNFGDSSSNGKPYMQLLSVTDPKKAVAQVTTIRTRTMANLPPEMPPSQVIKYLQSNTTSAASDGDAATLSEDNSFYSTFGINVEDIKKYGLIALCLLGTNVVIGLVLLVVVVVHFIRKRSPGGSGRHARQMGIVTEYMPVKGQEDESTAYTGYSKQ